VAPLPDVVDERAVDGVVRRPDSAPDLGPEAVTAVCARNRVVRRLRIVRRHAGKRHGRRRRLRHDAVEALDDDTVAQKAIEVLLDGPRVRRPAAVRGVEAVALKRELGALRPERLVRERGRGQGERGHRGAERREQAEDPATTRTRSQVR